MTLDTLAALAGFAFVMSISPGPANFLLLASGANFGLRRTLPLLFGVSFGFLFMVLLVGIGLGEVIGRSPILYTLLRAACGAYVLWLAFNIARSRSLGPAGEERVAAPIGFFKAALLQWVNPKAWTAALVVNVAYAAPDDPLPGLARVIAVFAVVNIPSIGTWALCGASLRRMLATGRRIVVFNAAMAALLAGSMVPMLLNLG